MRAWVKVTHSEQSKNNFLNTMGKRRREKFKTLSYNKALYEFHCIEKKYRILSITSYSFDDGVIQSGNVPLEWDFVVPDSMAELLSKVVCK